MRDGTCLPLQTLKNPNVHFPISAGPRPRFHDGSEGHLSQPPRPSWELVTWLGSGAAKSPIQKQVVAAAAGAPRADTVISHVIKHERYSGAHLASSARGRSVGSSGHRMGYVMAAALAGPGLASPPASSGFLWFCEVLTSLSMSSFLT